MVHSIGPRLSQCYDALVERASFQTGTAILSFSVTPQARIERVLIEQLTLEEPGFRRCLSRAMHAISPQMHPRGGLVRFAYILRFGPQ